MDFHANVLTPPQRALLKDLGERVSQRGFYLAGGTATALHLGHRKSDDIDLFIEDDIDPLSISTWLSQFIKGINHTEFAPNTLHALAEGVRLSFLSYKYPLLEETTRWIENGILIASIIDIACMKLVAIAQRGARKDFIDLYAILETGNRLSSILESFQIKYASASMGSILIGLTYFDTADSEPDPAGWSTSWEMVKKTIIRTVKQVRDAI